MKERQAGSAVSGSVTPVGGEPITEGELSADRGSSPGYHVLREPWVVGSMQYVYCWGSCVLVIVPDW